MRRYEITLTISVMAKNNEVIGSYIDDMVRFARITARVTEDLKMHDFVDTRIESL